MTYLIVEDHPRGYPLLSAIKNNNDFLKIYRKFGHLRARLVLHRQIESCKLEEKLIDADKEDSNNCACAVMSCMSTTCLVEVMLNMRVVYAIFE